ncbi:MAG: pilus assembly protein PilP [Deltaproteobacteria bacterium]|nr:pilus assembly protein PilP [Deltaproteobacteria bacterium]
MCDQNLYVCRQTTMRKEQGILREKIGISILWTGLVLAGSLPMGPQDVQGIGPPEAAATAATTTAAKIEETYHYNYNPTGKRDPFKPFIDVELDKKKTVEQSRPLSLNPLQRQTVEQFRLVGIIGDNKGRRAMVQDNAGKFYSLLPGAYIGLNNGRISKILADRIIVDEKIRTEEGKIESRRIIIKLRQGEGKP